MEQKILNLPENQDHFLIKKIKENLILIEKNGEKYIIKGKRDKERSFLENIRFSNEKRIYNSLNNSKFSHLRYPANHIDPISGNLILDYINKQDVISVKTKDYISSYFELQRITPSTNRFIDIFNQTFRSFFYRTFLVGLLTLPKKIEWKFALKAMWVVGQLNFKQSKLNRKYWVHGDLTGRNYFYDQNKKLYFIDFENMFYTRKWFLAEIVGKSFKYDYEKEKIIFAIDNLQEYQNQLNLEDTTENFCYYTQIRFGVIQYSILQIAQSKLVDKRRAYIELLLKTIDKSSFQKWYFSHVESHLR